MFTYSHANTPLGQSERADHLNYFIKLNINKRKYFKNSFIVAVFVVLPAKTNILINSFAVPLSSTIDAGFGLFFMPIRDKHSIESWNWFVKSSILAALSPVL